jgi:carboxyl-terminal processing protease
MAGAALPAGDIGLVLARQYYLRVVAAREGSPAARAGIRTGDYIRIINRQPTRDMSVWEGRALLRGDPGTAVTLTILRGNATEPHVVDVIRARPAAPAPVASIAAPGVGLVRLSAFTDTTPAALTQAVARVTADGATSLILDLRGCAGGPLEAGVEAARIFVATGTIGLFEARGRTRQTVTAGAGDGAVAVPMAVLVDGGTSGPAEVLAAALAGAKRAELIGERTAGQTARQKLFPLPDGSALWMSYAYYLTSGGEPIHQRGLVPAVVVEQPDVDFGAALPLVDATVARAVERLTGRTSP